jgi:hypothetical protein
MLNSCKNRHEGQRAVLVCNGPSLNNMDLSFLKNEICFGLNKIYLGFTKYNFYPKYFVAVNEKVLLQSEKEIKNLTSVKFLSNRCPGLFHNNALTHIIDTSSPPANFCQDITNGLEEGYTVTYAALQVAYYLGFKEIVIIGMDHRFEYSGKPNQSKFLKGPDNNHFCTSYFSNENWDNPDLVNSEASYKVARNIYEKSGRNIVDATVNGACNVFNKQDYRSIFQL